MTSLKTGGEIPKEILRHRAKYEQAIKHIEDYINTTSLDKPLKVYRDDDGYILNYIKFSDGINLYDKLNILFKTKNKEKIQELVLELSNKVYEPLTQERFVSTTFVKENRFKPEESIRWELDVPEGIKGTFIETYNDKTKNGKEIEYLMQRDSKIIIKDIQWSDEFNCWYIKADIRQK